MSLSAHPSRSLERGYGRRVEGALLIAIGIHAAVFLLAPPYVARPYRLDATPMRLVSAGAIGAGAGAPGTPAASAPTPAVSRPHSIVTEQLRLASPAAPETVERSAPAPARGNAGASSGQGGTGTEGADQDGAGEGPPPVFYAFDSPPQIVARVEPEYPLAARLSGAEGAVVLNANVDAKGRVMRVWVARSTAPDGLVESAMDALYRFRFTPGSQQGIPVPCTVAVPFNFHLNIHVETTGGQHER